MKKDKVLSEAGIDDITDWLQSRICGLSRSGGGEIIVKAGIHFCRPIKAASHVGEAIVLMVTPHHLDRYRDPQPPDRFEISLKNVTFNNVLCRAERPNAVVGSDPVIQNIRFDNLTLEIVPEDKPSLKGNTIDLSPGLVHFLIPRPGIGLVQKNCMVSLGRHVNEFGIPLEVITQ